MSQDFNPERISPSIDSRVIDRRHEYHRTAQTWSEILDLTTRLNSSGGGVEELQQNAIPILGRLGSHCIGTDISVVSPEYILLPRPDGQFTSIEAKQDPGSDKDMAVQVDGRFEKFVVIAQHGIRPAGIHLCIFHGTSVFDNGIIKYDYPRTTLIPVGKHTEVTSVKEIESIFFDPPDQRGTDTAKGGDERLIATLDRARAKLTGTKLYDPRATDGLEPWDYNNPKAKSLCAIRSTPVDAIAERGSFQYEIADKVTIRTRVHDLSFQGHFLGISPDASRRTFNPCFVFSVDYVPHDQSDKNSILQHLVENEPKTPLLYVPISDAVKLEINIP